MEALAAEAVAMVGVEVEDMEVITTVILLIVESSTAHIITSDKNFTLPLFNYSVKNHSNHAELKFVCKAV